ncbi:MAG: flippase-like domain-containing protein [Acidimicrobiales bacterium]|nr:flippase-like domain-containing protein [Acidimicrobiales bacterium]
MSAKRSSASRRAVKRTLFVLFFLFVIYYIVLPQWAQSRESADLIRQVNPLLLALAVGLQGSALIAYTVLTRVTLPPEPHLSMFTIFRIQLATKSVTNIVPGGSAAGGTLGYRLFTESGVPPTAAGFAMATVGLGSAVVLNLLLWVALLISIPLNGYNPLYAGAALVGVLLLASAGALVYLLMEGRDRAEKVLRAIARRVPYVHEDTASRFVHQLAERLHELARQPELIKSGVLWATANWLLEAASLWVFLRAFGSSVNPINLVVAFGLAGVLAAIPITPGGLGVVEAALAPTLVGFGVPANSATIAVLCWRFAQFWLPIPLGGIAYLSLKMGTLGRQRRLGTVRDLAHETGQAASRRVWDDATGEYRWVAHPRTEEPTAAGEPHTDEPHADEPIADEPDVDEPDADEAAS